MSYDTKRYLIEFFDGTSTAEYEEYLGQDAHEAVEEFRENHPKAILQNVCLILENFSEVNYENND
jgi:hypothetical protein